MSRGALDPSPENREISRANAGPASSAVSVPGSPRPVTPASILSSRLGDLYRRAGPIDPLLEGELREICELADGLDPYLERWSTPESAALKALTRRTQQQDWNRHAEGSGSSGSVHLEQEMLSGHVEGQLLKMLVHATRAQRILEIGMFTGYSALAMAEALPDDGELVACEIDAEVAAFAQGCFQASPAGHKIVVAVGPALQTLDTLSARGASFELIFIDADKAGYAGYLDAILESGLLSVHGLICVDNTLMQGQPWRPGAETPNGRAIARFNEKVAADPRVEQVIIPLRDGLTLIRRVDGGRSTATAEGMTCTTR